MRKSLFNNKNIFVKAKKTKVSVVIPVYNEEKTIAKVVEKIKSLKLKGIKFEIIIINDGSTDGTEIELKKIRKLHKNIHFINKINEGKGSALRLGIKHSTGKIIVPQDADLELDPSDYERLITPILEGKTSVVFGFRNWAKAEIPFHSKVANFVVTFLANFLYSANIMDEACGYKVMTKCLYQSLNLKSNGFEICPETLSKVIKLGYKIKSVSVKFHPRKFSDGKKIKLKDGLTAFWFLIKFRFIA